MTFIIIPFRFGTVSMPSTGGGEDTILTHIAKTIGLFASCWFVAFSIIVMAWKRTVRELPLVLREGMLMPVFVLVAVMGSIGMLGSIVAPDTSGIVSSLMKLPTSGVSKYEFVVPAGTEPQRGEVDIRVGDVGGWKS